MLTLIIGPDWVENRAHILQKISQDVSDRKANRILIVPELISHEMERRLCAAAGDTTSLYAEVLSFSRLVRRVADAVEQPVPQCLDNGGRVVAMASAVHQLHSKLKAYAAVETRPEFLEGLLDAVDEFKRCCISPEDLMSASRQLTGSLAQKLEELSLILSCYDGICARGARDPRDQMNWLLNELADSDFAAEHAFYIDGFPDFTRQHMAILEHLIRHCPQVTVSINTDKIGSDALAFERAGQTAAELLTAAKAADIPYEILQIPGRMDELSYMREKLFQGAVEEKKTDALQMLRTDTVYQECVAAAEQIAKLVQAGARYRQISVVCGDFGTYRNTIEMVFSRCNIPVYLSGTEPILNRSVITTVLTALDAALGGFAKRDVLDYAKSVLSPLAPDLCDQLENYAVIWNIDGSKWLTNWDKHPSGLSANWTPHAQAKLEALNRARQRIIDPLQDLSRGFAEAKNLGQQIQALYGFLEQIRFEKRLKALADEMDAQGDNRTAQIFNQLWEILLTSLEQMYDVLGNTAWEPGVFSRLFRLMLSQYDVGTIPTVLDSVVAGPVSAMRCQKETHLIVMGALEGNLPGYCGASGVLTDQERVSLRQIGVPLTGGSVDGLQAEFAEIYGVFCGAVKSVRVTCPSGQPSFVYQRLLQITGRECQFDQTIGISRCDPFEAGALFSRLGNAQQAADAGVAEQYLQVNAHKNHVLGEVSRENIEKLYGEKLLMSASQIDRQAQCRLSYFLRYGLHAQERKEATVDPAEFGTYVHYVLENTVQDVMQLGGFKMTQISRVMEIAADYSETYAAEHFQQIDSQRAKYLFERNFSELQLIVQELFQEFEDSEFAPVGVEVAFGEGMELPAIDISGKQMDAQLRGFVDRVDAWHDGEGNYFRVVDYKTGKKDFDYCDVFNGLGLQMLLYLFALEQKGSDLVGTEPIPAGVQYFPARVPMVSADGVLSDAEADAAREKLWKRKGLLLNHDLVLDAMAGQKMQCRLPVTRKRDGSVSGDLATFSQFAMLKDYVFSLLGRMVDEIASGKVAPNPYSRGNSHDACAFCPYGAVCHKTEVPDRRNYKTMNAERFWSEVERAVRSDG